MGMNGYPRKLKAFVKGKLPSLVVFYRTILNIRRQIIYLLPVSVRLRKGMNITISERKKLVQKLYKQSEEQPLFSGKRVLCWEPAPYPVHIDIISTVGVALSLRGCHVEQVICDGTPVACIGREIVDNEPFPGWEKRCQNCFRACKNEANSFGLKTVTLEDLVDSDVLTELRRISQTIALSKIHSYTYKGVNVGLYAESSLIRYYKGKMNEFEEHLLRGYLFSALVATEAAANKIDSFQPDAIYMSHAIYTPWGPAYKIALQRGIPVIKMGGGYLPGFTYFRKLVAAYNVHQGVLSDSGWEERRKKPLTSEEKEILDNYLEERYTKSGTDLSISNKPTEDEKAILSRLNIDHSKPIWCVLTNLGWDASLDVAPMAFPTPTEWLVETIKAIIDMPHVQWLIKIHPAEATSNTIQGAQDIIKKYFPDFPSDIKVIPPDTDINTYDIYKVIDGGVTCLGNTSGMEMSILGKPIIDAGESIYAKKGFSYDGLTPAEYLNYLRTVPNLPPLTEEQQESACRLAYSYFIQRQIPLRMFNVKNNRFDSFDWRKVELLLPGRDPVIDMICDRFFNDQDFILDDRTIQEYKGA